MDDDRNGQGSTHALARQEGGQRECSHAETEHSGRQDTEPKKELYMPPHENGDWIWRKGGAILHTVVTYAARAVERHDPSPIMAQTAPQS